MSISKDHPPLTLNQFIEKLISFKEIHGGNILVSICDGFQGTVYEGPFEIQHFIELDGIPYCDIGIGGMEVNSTGIQI